MDNGYCSVLKLKSSRDQSIAALHQEFDRILGILTRARDLAIVLGFEAEFAEAVEGVRKAADAVPLLKVV